MFLFKHQPEKQMSSMWNELDGKQPQCVDPDFKPAIKEKREKKVERKESVKFTEEEMAAIGKVIFGGEESNLDYAVRFWLDQEKLEGYQKILLAPGNAIEGLVKFGISLFDKKTYHDLYKSLEMIQDTEMRKILKEAIGKGWENCTWEEKTAFIVEIAYSALFVYKGLDKLAKILPAGKAAALAKKIINAKTAARLKNMTKAIIASPVDDAVVIGATVAGTVGDKMKDVK